jgi:hypothetical protein
MFWYGLVGSCVLVASGGFWFCLAVSVVLVGCAACSGWFLLLLLGSGALWRLVMLSGAFW